MNKKTLLSTGVKNKNLKANQQINDALQNHVHFQSFDAPAENEINVAYLE